MSNAKAYIQASFEAVKARNPHETEFLQAVEELFSTLEPVFEAHQNTSKKTSWLVSLSLSVSSASVFHGQIKMEMFKSTVATVFSSTQL